jgi:hypothetical protein
MKALLAARDHVAVDRLMTEGFWSGPHAAAPRGAKVLPLRPREDVGE